MDEPSVLSIVPPLFSLVLAVTTRNVLVSLGLGVFLGMTIHNGWNPFFELLDVVERGVFAQLAYVLGEIISVSSIEAAEVAGVTPATFRKRLSRSRKRITNALVQHCGLVEPSARCHYHRRLERAAVNIASGP